MNRALFNARIDAAILRRREDLADDRTIGDGPKIWSLIEGIRTLEDIKQAINDASTSLISTEKS